MTVDLSAWQGNAAVEDEQGFTPWADSGWFSYNGASPEVEIIEFFARLVRLLQPALVVETGVGQGYMTRAIVAQLAVGQRLLAHESSDEWRDALAPLPFWNEHAEIAELSATAVPTSFGEADLCFLDSDFPIRIAETALWNAQAKPGAVALIHDTGHNHDETTFHSALKETIVSLGMKGVFLSNPRGAFLALKS